MPTSDRYYTEVIISLEQNSVSNSPQTFMLISMCVIVRGES